MNLAGTEKSFLGFINALDFSEWDVRLLLAKKEGPLLSELPKEVTVDEMENGDLFLIDKNNASKIIWNSYLKKNIFRGFGLLKYLFEIIFFKKEKKTFAKNRMWIKMMKSLPDIIEPYDVAISYWGDRTAFYLNEKVINSKKKINWIHFDINFPPREHTVYYECYKNMDYNICVSETIKEEHINEYPDIKDKFICIGNHIDTKQIIKMSEEEVDIKIIKEKSIVTLARVVYEKGYDLGLDIIKEIKKDIPDIKWYIIGGCDKNYKESLECKITKSGLSDNVVFLGEQLNPYKYISKSGVYFQPSRTEGESVSIKEAMVLGKYIIASDIESISRQLISYENKNIMNMKNISENAKIIIEILGSNIYNNENHINSVFECDDFNKNIGKYVTD